MRPTARRLLGATLVVALLAVGWLTLYRLGDIDPRGRASWATTPITFDDTPRDLTVFLPACDVRAIVLHPSADAMGRLGIEYVRLMLDRRHQVVERSGAGSAEVFVAGSSPVVLPMRAVEPGWREAITLRVRLVDHVGQPMPGRPPITLDPVTPATLDAVDAGLLGRLACAFDAGNRTSAWTVAIAMLAMLTCAGVLAAWWIWRAFRLGPPAIRPGDTAEAPHDLAAATSARGATAAALGVVAATTMAYSLVVPPFEPPDELAHLQYARFVATTGSLPSAVPPHDSEWRAASYEFVQQPLYYLGAAALLKATGLETPGPAVTLNPRSRLRPGGTEPSIFWHATPPQPATGHRALRLLRVASLLMALATTWLIARLLTTVTADPLVIATVAGGLGLIPQWCAVMGAVSTDPPATLLAAAATLAIVRVTLGHGSTGMLLLTGLLIGAAYAVKATAVFLAPMAIVACLAAARRGARRRAGASTGPGLSGILGAALRPVLVVGAGIALAAAWIHVRAWVVFGDPSAQAFKRAVLEAGGFVPTPGPMPWTPEFWQQMRVMVFEPFWARFGSLGAGPFPGSKVWLPYAAASVLLAALAAWGALAAATSLWRVRYRGPAAPDSNAVVLVCALGVGVGLAAWGLVNLVPRADMVVHWTPRHILPLTAPAALLVGAGLERLRTAGGVTPRLGAAATGLTIVGLALAWLGVLRATVLMFHFGY